MTSSSFSVMKYSLPKCPLEALAANNNLGITKRKGKGKVGTTDTRDS